VAFPRQDDIDDALLVFLFRRGGKDHALRASETYRPLADFFGLSADERMAPRPKNQGPVWNSWVMMAKHQLKERGYVFSAEYGRWQLTDAGRAHAEQLLKSPNARYP
jgi:restriction endonuclease Mrr